MDRTFRFIATATGISLIFISGSYAQTPVNAVLMHRADSLYFARDWSNARNLYIKLLSDTSRNSIAWNRLGFSNYNTGDYENALKCYQKALVLNPVPPVKASAYSRMARINALQNKNEEAFANIDSAVTAGFNDFPELDTLKYFDKIRNTARFKLLRTKTYHTAFPCMADSHAREFDFWTGEWNVFVTGTNTLAGHSVIQIISGGCAILENWTSNNGFNNGKRINFIDPVTNKWKQSWAGGGNQEFVNGEYKDGAMRFTFETVNAKNQKIIGIFQFFSCLLI